MTVGGDGGKGVTTREGTGSGPLRPSILCSSVRKLQSVQVESKGVSGIRTFRIEETQNQRSRHSTRISVISEVSYNPF